MASASPAVFPLATGEQAKSLKTLRGAAQVAAGVLILLGLARVVTGALLIANTPLVALFGVVEGAVSIFLGLILLKIATDLQFAQEVPHLAALHVVNALDSWRDFCKTLIALAIVAFLAALVRLS